jgi:hypothetical protein
VKADSDVEIPWSRLEYGRWRRECVCGAEGWQEPTPNRVRQDPYDPATMRQLPQCEFKDVSDPSILKALVKVTPKDGYSWMDAAPARAAGRFPTTPSRCRRDRAKRRCADLATTASGGASVAVVGASL